MPFSPEHPTKLVVFDLDNTLIACDSSQLWIDYLYEEGVVTDPFYKEENDRMVAEYHKGTLDIAAYLRAVTPAVYGIEPERLNVLLNDFAERWIRPKFYREGLERIERAKALGIPVQIISATCTYIVKPIAERLGVLGDHVIGIDLVTDEKGRLTGEILGVPSFREGKVERVQEVLSRYGLKPEDMLFFTDSRNDLPLALYAGATEVVDPDPVLREKAKEMGWPVHEWHVV